LAYYFNNFSIMSEAKPQVDTSEQVVSKEGMEVQILETLATAFGGHSQVPDRIVGMALAGRINNGAQLLGAEDAIPVFNRLVEQICERWKDQGMDPKEVRDNLIAGMKEQAKEWGEENRVWGVIRALESEAK